MNSKKAKQLRKLVFGDKCIRPETREYATTNKSIKRYSIADYLLLKKTKEEIGKTFSSFTKVSVKLRAQYQRLKSKVKSDLNKSQQEVAITPISQFQKKRTKTQKNQDKRTRKFLRAQIS